MANPLLYAGARVALKATRLAAKGLKKVIAKNKAPKKPSKFAKNVKIARSKVQNNPALVSLKNQSWILKENRRQGFPLGNLPSAWSKIQKSTGASYRNVMNKSKGTMSNLMTKSKTKDYPVFEKSGKYWAAGAKKIKKNLSFTKVKKGKK
tara:strand:+ start:354 stop:803 length:450 start_codon:yes stop_codon:yes gene_type:complete